jgi:hypothetical protein
MMNRVVKIVLGVVMVLVIAGGSFYGGTVYGQNEAQSNSTAAGDWQGRSAGTRQFGSLPSGQDNTDRAQSFAAQGGSLFGEIQSVGDGQMTILDQSGKQVQITVTDTTLIQKQAEVTMTDLQQGETVAVSGRQEDDGSITARMVQVTSDNGFGLPGGFPPGGQPGSDTGSANP